MLNKRKLRRIERLVEKRLHKTYKKSAYFFFDKVTNYFADMEGMVDLHCVAGHEIVEKGIEIGEYNQITFSFSVCDELVRGVHEMCAVLALYVVDELDGMSHFEKKQSNMVKCFFNMLGVLISIPVLVLCGAIVVGVAFLFAMGILIYLLLTT